MQSFIRKNVSRSVSAYSGYLKASYKRVWMFTFIFLVSGILYASKQATTDSLINIMHKEEATKQPSSATLLKIADIYTNSGDNDTALYYLSKAQKLCENLKDSISLVEIMVKQGICFDQKGSYKQSAEVYYKALNIAEKLNEKKLQAKVLINLGILHFNLQKGESAIGFYRKALAISELINDSINMVRSVNNIGNVYMTLLGDLKKAEIYFIKTVELGEKIKFGDAVKVGMNNLSEIYSQTGQLDKAIQICTKALKILPNCPFAHYNMASIWKLKKEYDKALECFALSLKLGYNYPELKQVILKETSEIWALKRDYNKALQYYQQYVSLKDSVHKTVTDNHIKEMEIKYQTAEREHEIQKLNGIKKQHKILISGLVIILVAGTFAGLLFFRNIRNKKVIAEQFAELKEQKIKELEKDNQLIASHAVLEGEEKERGRLARDLHDGLGGLLSGIKLKLSDLKGNYVIKQEHDAMFDHALNLLDNSIKELRRVAHNMMPEALLKFGLKDALDDFCRNLSGNKDLKLTFNFFGEPQRFENALEITLYRIAQELINNAIKHSGASDIIVHLVQEKKRIHLTVSDNGKGFDPSKVDSLKSAGLQNIKARVKSFNGIIDIDSEEGKGTEIGVEFKI